MNEHSLHVCKWADRASMGIPIGTMTVAEISDAIPPAYSKFVAEAWLRSRLARAAE
jgi:hypothetical protein